jgi:phage terminase large subunit-like protein
MSPFFDYRFLRESALHPTREDISTLTKLRHEMGSHAFSAQYLQQPQSRENGMVKPHWLARYTQSPETPSIIQSWDTAIKTGSQNDPSVCLTFATHENQHYLLEVLREKLEYPQLRKAILAQAERWKPQAILIEDKASGQSLLQDLRQQPPPACDSLHAKPR